MTETEFSKYVRKDLFQVFLFSSPCNLPLSFARHHWFVTNKLGEISRWEVLFRNNSGPNIWGHLNRNFLAPAQGIEMLPFSDAYFWKSKLISQIEGGPGSPAESAASFIENSPQSYKHCHTYSLLGPNSNTYAQWVLDNVPEFKIKLPRNSFGAGYR